MDKRALKKTITDFLDPLPYIRFAYLFGSLASGNAGALSDIDIAVFFDDTITDGRGLTYSPECELSSDLEQILGQPVDLAVLNTASVFLRYQVLKKGELLFCRSEKERIQFHEETIRSYLDFLPFRAVQNLLIVRKWGKRIMNEVLLSSQRR